MTSKRVEERRVQKLGTSSLVVTLPKKWVRSVGLRPGDIVRIIPGRDYIIIQPRSSREELNEATLTVDNSIREEALQDIIKCLYINDIKKIIINLENLKATTINKIILTLRHLPDTEHELTENELIIYSKTPENDDRLVKLLSRLLENLGLILSSVEEYLDKGINRDLVVDTKSLLDESLRTLNDLTRIVALKSRDYTNNINNIKYILYELISKDIWNLTKIASNTIETLHSMKLSLPQEEAASVINGIVQLLIEIKKYIFGDSRIETLRALLDKIIASWDGLPEKSPYIFSKAETFTIILSNILEYLQCLEAAEQIHSLNTTSL